MSARTQLDGAVDAPAPARRRTTRVVGAAVAVGALSASLVVAGAGTASAAASTVSGVSLAWGLSGEQGGGAFFGGCNFLSAGTAGSTGSSRLWTEADGFYKTSSGNVTVTKPDTAGTHAQPMWATKCQGPNGVAVTPFSAASLTGNRVNFAGGTGTVNVAANTARIAWTGSFTSVFYGGLTYWFASNPVLTVSGGVGTLNATVSGYGAAMDDPSQWVKIPARKLTLATISGLTVTSTGFTATPDYLGVSVEIPEGGTAQSAPGSPNHGSFPQGFIDFQQLTGQSSYWYSSGGSRDAAKPAVPVTVGWELPGQVAASITAQPASTTVAASNDATFTVGVAGTPTPTVKWQVLPKGGTAWAVVAGARSTTLTLENVHATMHGNRYRAVVTNGVGAQVVSSAAVLKVVNPT